MLGAIIATFGAPAFISYNRIATTGFSVALLLLLLLALYVVDIDDLIGKREALEARTKRHRIIGWALAIPAIAGRVAFAVLPVPGIYLVGSIWWLALCSFITWSQWRTVLKQRNITTETVSMSISVYLLIGFTFGVLYVVLNHLQSFSFNFAGPLTHVPAQRRIIPHLIYFSLATLSAAGTSEITPVTLQARYAVVAEGIIGQLYLAIMIARIVGMQMSQVTTLNRV